MKSATFIAGFKEEKAVSQLNEILKKIVYTNDKVTGLFAIDQTVVNPETLEIGFKYKEKYNFIDPDTEQNLTIYTSFDMVFCGSILTNVL